MPKESTITLENTIEPLEAALDLIDQYEEPRKNICGQSSVTRNAIDYFLKHLKKQIEESKKGGT